MRGIILENTVTRGHRITRALVIAQDPTHAVQIVKSYITRQGMNLNEHLFGTVDIGMLDHPPVEPLHRFEGGALLIQHTYEPPLQGISHAQTVTEAPPPPPAPAPSKPVPQPQGGQTGKQRKSGDHRKPGVQQSPVAAQGPQGPGGDAGQQQPK